MWVMAMKRDPEEYRGLLALMLGASLLLVVLIMGAVAIVDSFTGNNMRPEDLQMTITLVIALLGTIGTYLGVESVMKNKRRGEEEPGEPGPPTAAEREAGDG